MHEASIAEALINTAEEEVRNSGSRKGAKIRNITIKVGPLSGVSVDALRFAFEMLKKGTRLEQAELRVEQTHATCICRDCGKKSIAKDLLQGCPLCHGYDIRLEGGDELLIESIEVEE